LTTYNFFFHRYIRLANGSKLARFDFLQSELSISLSSIRGNSPPCLCTLAWSKLLEDSSLWGSLAWARLPSLISLFASFFFFGWNVGRWLYMSAWFLVTCSLQNSVFSGFISPSFLENFFRHCFQPSHPPPPNLFRRSRTSCGRLLFAFLCVSDPSAQPRWSYAGFFIPDSLLNSFTIQPPPFSLRLFSALTFDL